MVQLAFAGASGRRPVKEIPEAPGVAVVAPMGNSRHVTQHGIERNPRLVPAGQGLRRIQNKVCERLCQGGFVSQDLWQIRGQ